jgi:hypothetical protein
MSSSTSSFGNAAHGLTRPDMENMYYRDDNQLAYITGAPVLLQGSDPQINWGQVRVIFLNPYNAIDHRQHVRILEAGYKPRPVGCAV